MKGILQSPVALIVGVPFAFLIFVALAGYVPTLFVHPGYDFVYATTGGSYYASPRDNYFVDASGHIAARTDPTQLLTAAQNTRDPIVESARSTKFYRFNVATWSAAPLSYQDALQLHLSDAQTAPDGYTLKSAYGSSGVFPFFMYSTAGPSTVIQRGVLSKQLPVNILSDYQTRGAFIGWILP